MPVMAVNNENQHGQASDYRSRPRWSAGKKMEAVLRLLRGEPLETLSRGRTWPRSATGSPTLAPRSTDVDGGLG
jgi:hypothetical protein